MITIKKVFILIFLIESTQSLISSQNESNLLSTTSSSTNSGYRYTSFQNGIICDASHPPLTPSTLSDLQTIVEFALQNNINLKPLGNLHSGTDIICTTGIPINMGKITHFRFDPETKIATIGAGSTLGNFLENLHKLGRTISGVPTYLDITIGGAIGIGAHGTNLKNPAALSDQIVSLLIVDGLGQIRNISDPLTVDAFRANFGLLGIVFEVNVQTIPQFKFKINNYPVSDKILRKAENIVEILNSNDRLQFFWFPTLKSVVLSVGNPVPVEEPGNCQTNFISEAPLGITAPLSEALENMQEGMDHLGYFAIQSFTKLTLFQSAPGRSPIFSREDSGGRVSCDFPAVGWSHLMAGNRCDECVWNHGNQSVFQFEFAAIIPLEELDGAVKTIKRILDVYPMEFPLTGIYFRFLSGSNGFLTVNSGRSSVAIEWVLVQRKDQFNKPMLGLPGSQAILQALISKHDGRPHWGKNGPIYTRQALLLERYPKLPQFIEKMEEFDPKRIFLNDFGRRLRFGERKAGVDNFARYCGLVDACICGRDEDCGRGDKGAYLCDLILNEYRVCKENEGSYGSFRGKIVRKVVNSLKER